MVRAINTIYKKNKIFWLGTAAEILYLSLFLINFLKASLNDASIPPRDTTILVILFIFFILSFAVYCLMFSAVKTEKPKLQTIILFAAIFAASLIVLQPILSADMFGAILRGRIGSVYHSNPYLFAPNLYPNDMFTRLSPWLNTPAHYGPLWTSASMAITSLFKNSFIAAIYFYKFFVFLFFAGSAVLVYKITKNIDKNYAPTALILFSWNPLILITTIGNAHNDIAMMFFALLSFWLLAKQKKILAVCALACGFLIKYIIIIIAPLLFVYLMKNTKQEALIKKIIKNITIIALPIIVISFMFYYPFWEGPRTFNGIYMVQNNFFLMSIPFAIRGFINLFFPISLTALKIILWLIFIIVFCRITTMVYKTPTIKNLIKHNAIALLVFILVVATEFFPWFMLWFVCLAVLINNKTMQNTLLFATLVSLLSYSAPFVIIIPILLAIVILINSFLKNGFLFSKHNA